MNVKMFEKLLITFFLLIFIDKSASITNSNDFYLWNRLLNVSNETLAKIFLPNYIETDGPLFRNENLTEKCLTNLIYIRDSMFGEQRKTWAFRLFNSWPSSIIPVGMILGTMTDYGDYDQCMSIDPSDLIVKYCLIDMTIPMPMPRPSMHNLFHTTKNILPNEIINNKSMSGNFYYDLGKMSSFFYYSTIRKGICLPTDCIDKDIEIITEKGFGREIFDLKINKMICTTKQTKSWQPNNVQILSILFIGFFILMTIISGIYDWFIVKKKSNTITTCLLWFSPMSNMEKILSSKMDGQDLTCLHGIRVLSMCWIIMGHIIPFFDMNRFSHLFLLKNEIINIYSQPLLKGFYAVETFFFLSGMLVSYTTIRLTNGNYKNFRIIPFLLIRFLRLTPQLLAFMIIITILPPLFDGPVWQYRMQWMIDSCEKSWWKNLIFLQNLINSDDMCEPHLWYLAADMQLHWLSLLPLIFLLKNPKRGLLFKNSPPGAIVSSPGDFRVGNKSGKFLKFYDKPWSHAHVFLIGFIFGYHLRQIKPNHFHWTKWKTLMAWMTIIIGIIICIYDTYPWLSGLPYLPIWSALISPLNGLLWSMILTIIIFICITDPESFISKILSWSFFRPLSRMTFSVFLTHFLVIYVIRDSSRNLFHLHYPSIIMLNVSAICLAYSLGFLFTLLFESPIVSKIILLERSQSHLYRRIRLNVSPDDIAFALNLDF
uniref:Nose resistant to fluoxetine protein 6-like n=1 Tax=Dermatophagoides pteronyssinus TaxID=6956 RepID=A0A6P6Y782_DERPT|nr:nose resistant to fluoxetine protein 6-like [Dermatophagoides pteronyssinus]